MGCGRIYRPQSGFTLLEVLVSMAAGALLIGTLSQVLITIRDGWRLASRIDRQWAEEATAVRLVSRLLRASLPPERGGFGARFKGDGDTVEFTSIPSQSAFSSGRMDGRLYLESRQNGSLALLLDLVPRPASPVSPVSEKLVRTNWVVLEDLEKVEFSYFAGSSGRASRSWNDAEKLPDVIQLHADFVDKTRPSLRMAIRLHQTLSGSCVIEWTSLACRPA